MKNIIGKKLRYYRKRCHYSLEEVESELGISIDKILDYEENNVVPTIDELIKFSKFYNVSLNDLISTNFSFDYEDDDEKNNIKLGDININEERIKSNINKGVNITLNQNRILYSPFVLAVSVIVVTIIYLTLGFTLPNQNIWGIYWVLYFLPFILSSFVEVLETKKLYKFNAPLLITFIYVLVGQLTSIWHPTRILFLAIPMFYCFIDAIKKFKMIKY